MPRGPSRKRRARSGTPLRRAALERLTRYYQCIRDRIRPEGGEAVTSAQIAGFVEVDDTLVRKDLHLIGLRGTPHVGFDRGEVLKAIRRELAFDETHEAVIIGAGRLGGAIASYEGFAEHGLAVAGIFDIASEKIGTSVAGLVVQHDDEMESIIGECGVRLAILTVPRDAAQRSADRVIAAGVRTIWNFAPTGISVPPDVFVRDERLAVGLAVLSYHLGRTP